MAVPLAPVLVPSQRTLARLSRQSLLSVNEMIPGAVHRSPGICLVADENPVKHQLGDVG